MKYYTCIAAMVFGFASLTAIAAEPSDENRAATPEAARGGEPANSQESAKTTGGQQSDANAAGPAGEKKTGQASSAETTDAQGSEQATSNPSGDASPEAARKTGQASSASDSSATPAQDQSSQGQDNADNNSTTDTANSQTESAPRDEDAYSAELKKCDSMQGNDKEKCIASAKKKSGQM